MLFKPVIPVLEYVVFYDYIKNELCENKEIAEMECNGKCHLVKELAKASDAPENGKEKRDRKSTRLNSSHVRISYAVFCLKKKKKQVRENKKMKTTRSMKI